MGDKLKDNASKSENLDSNNEITKETTENKKVENSGEIIDPEILEDLPPEVKKVVEMGISMQRISGPAPNPLFSKINENHIDKILQLAEKEESNTFIDAQSNKKYSVFYFIAIIAFFIFLIVFLVDRDKALLLSILEKTAYVLGGFGGGYGLKSYLDSKKEN